MIVTQTNEGWQIINQQAHGLLAVQLALHWRSDKRPIHWEETLIALTEHDDGQVAWKDRNHLTKVGSPLHFQILQYSVEQCKNLIQIGLQKSRWNALMMSMHTSFLYEPKRGDDKELDAFLDEQVNNQAAWRKQYKVKKADATYAYDFVQWFDALSLILCLEQIPPSERRLEVSVGPDGVSYYIWQRSNGTLSINPWPFDDVSFSAHVEVFHLGQLAFKDDHELYNTLQQAPIELREWVFKMDRE